MYSAFLNQLRTNLNEKRANLTDWLDQAAPAEKATRLGPATELVVHEHIASLETNLERGIVGELGVCVICNEPVNTRLLEMDYTAQVCLDHFTPEERNHLEQELELAQVAQKSLLPQNLPESPHLEISAFSRPAQVIGGDYFDFLHFADGAQGLAIADVAGHGISAALHMASIQALLRTLVPNSSSPADVIRHIQKLLIHNVHFTTFVTVFLASYDTRTHTLTYCNAGHNPPLQFRRDNHGEIISKWLSPTGAAIGLIEELAINESSTKVEPVDFLVLYTDGLTEAANKSGDQFGTDRLSLAASRWANSNTAALVQGIRQDLQDFTQTEILADDTTIVACRFLS
jgi:phosphoserine phosphatase RsbU/P